MQKRAARGPAAGHPRPIRTREPIMTLVLSSKTMSLRTLTEIADKQVARAIESVNGVGNVTLGGGRAREIHIVVDVEKLNAHGLTIEQVRDAMQKENVEIPGGNLLQGKSQLGLRTLGRIDATDQFNNIIIATVNGTPICISDIGYAEDALRARRERRSGWTTTPPSARYPPGIGREHDRGHRGVKRKLETIRRALPKDVTSR